VSDKRQERWQRTLPSRTQKTTRYKYIVCAMGNLRLFCTFLESSTSVLAVSALTYRRIVEHISWHVKAILCSGDACVGKLFVLQVPV
jgi:hypothetical protein